jgi:hypothetical protein
MRPITRIVGPNATPLPFASPPIRLDEWADAPLGIQVAVNGVATYTVEHSFDEGPDSLVSPLPIAQMLWRTDLVPLGAVGGALPITFSMATAPIWMRLVVNTGVGQVRMIVTQYNVSEG